MTVLSHYYTASKVMEPCSALLRCSVFLQSPNFESHEQSDGATPLPVNENAANATALIEKALE